MVALNLRPGPKQLSFKPSTLGGAMKVGSFLGSLAVALVFLATPGIARADLVSAGTVDVSGTGFGAVNTILTFQGTGQSMGMPESGCVGVSSAGAINTTGSSVCQGGSIGGNELSGASHNQTFTVSNASQIGVVFNADQPGGGNIQVTDLTLSLFNSSGQVGFTSGAFTPVTLDTTQPGIGKAGFLFELDSTQAGQAQTAINGGFDLLGLSATTSNAAGGPETFFLTNVSQSPGSSGVPEPGTLSTLSFGLLGLALIEVLRRQRGRQAA